MCISMYLTNEKYFSLHFWSFLFSILLSFFAIFVFGNLCFFLCLECYYCYHSYRRKDSSHWYIYEAFSLVLFLLCFLGPSLIGIYRLVLFGKTLYHLFQSLIPSTRHRLQERLYYSFLDGNHLESFVLLYHGPKVFLEEYRNMSSIPSRKDRLEFARSTTHQKLLSLRQTYELRHYGNKMIRTDWKEEPFCSFDFFYLLMNVCFLLLAILLRRW